MAMIDPWDPNNWDLAEPEYRIYLDRRADRYALVSREDYEWAIQWCWNIKRCKRNKEYARRAVSKYEDGERIGAVSIYLHIAIAGRMKLPIISANHKIVDHRNGKSLDCRRPNLRYATYSMNSKNINGAFAHDLEDRMYGVLV